MGVYIERQYVFAGGICMYIILNIINKYDCRPKTKCMHKSLLEEITR